MQLEHIVDTPLSLLIFAHGSKSYTRIHLLWNFLHVRYVKTNMVFHRRHVFKDLRPYVCTFAECTTPNEMFLTRREWFAHELKFHRKEWNCNDCNSAFATEKDILDHLHQNHPDACNAVLLPIILTGCSRVPTLDQQCLLCAGTFPASKIKNHVARHLQQLALYSLPRREDLEEVTGDDIEEEVSGDYLDRGSSSLGTQSADSGADSNELTDTQAGSHVRLRGYEGEES